MASAKISCFETASNSVMHDRNFMSSGKPRISVMGFSLAAETGDLRKDEPYPVCPFLSARQLLDDLPVDSGLRVHEALEVERITHGATPSTFVGTGLSAVPDSP